MAEATIDDHKPAPTGTCLGSLRARMRLISPAPVTGSRKTGTRTDNRCFGYQTFLILIARVASSPGSPHG
jgi:hypothetical protein